MRRFSIKNVQRLSFFRKLQKLGLYSLRIGIEYYVGVSSTLRMFLKYLFRATFKTCSFELDEVVPEKRKGIQFDGLIAEKCLDTLTRIGYNVLLFAKITCKFCMQNGVSSDPHREESANTSEKCLDLHCDSARCSSCPSSFRSLFLKIARTDTVGEREERERERERAE